MKPALKRFSLHRINLDIDALGNIELAWLSAVSALFLAGGLWLFLGWYAPPPKHTLTIAAGPSSGAYFQYALRYQALLQRHGVDAEVVETKGTIENFELLKQTSEGGADIAFVQGGPWGTSGESLQSLAAVGIEPIWVFVDPRRYVPKQLSELRGRHVDIGKEGSGTLPVARAMLQLAGLGPLEIQAHHLGGAEALAALRTGEVSAVLMVASASAPIVEHAIDSGLQVLPFGNALAFERRLPWSHSITLSRGLMSVARDAPPADLPMLAVDTNLVSRSDLHESTQFLLLDVASEAHAEPGPLQTARQYPSSKGLLFAQGEASKEFFRTGRPWLNKFLPFWSAYQINRLLLSLLPVLVIVLPLLKATIAFNERRNRAAIMRLHKQANELEFGMQTAGSASTAQALHNLERKLLKLQPLTIHSVEFFYVHEALRRLRGAGRRGLDHGLQSPVTSVGGLAVAPEAVRLKAVPPASLGRRELAAGQALNQK
jgi:hypothetical protein